MASVAFHHGTRVFQSGETPLLVKLAQTAVIGIIGTAPAADALRFPLNKPIQLLRPADAEGLGLDGTLMTELDTIWDQAGTAGPPIILVRIEEGEDMAETWGNAVGSQVSFTGVHAFRRAKPDGLYKPKLLIAPGLTQTSPADGIASVNVTTAGSGYTSAPTVTVAGSTGGTGAELQAVVAGGAISSILVVKPGWGFAGTLTVAITGGGGTGGAATANKGSVINPVVAELMGVAEVLEAVNYVDGPDTTDQAAVQYRALINSKRVFIADPKILKFDTEADLYVPQPSSPMWAARQARMDLEQGFWWAGSNTEIAGIGGVNRPIEYPTQSNYLNEHRVNTIVNIDGTGFRTWGVWTCSSDPLWQFVSVVRTCDAVNDALRTSLLTFIDKPFSKANLKFMIEGCRNFLRMMEREGAILPGHDAWLLDTNTNEDMAQGILKLGVKYEPPAPITDLRVTAYRNIASYTLLLNQVNQEISTTGGTLSAAA